MKKLLKLRIIELPKISLLDEEEMADILGGACSGRCSGYNTGGCSDYCQVDESMDDDCSGYCSGYKKQ